MSVGKPLDVASEQDNSVVAGSELATSTPRFAFYKGGEDIFADFGDTPQDWERAFVQTREHVGDAMNARHLSFLIGSGCSSLIRDKVELGVPSMAPMAKSLLASKEKATAIDAKDINTLKETLGLDVAATEYESNLERLLEVLFSYRYVLSRTSNKTLAGALQTVDRVIEKVTEYICNACSIGAFSADDQSVLLLYQAFYRRLIYRDRTLPRPWIFTTNYDLFNETALDRLGIQYCNGFSGTVERRFNPAVYRYALAEQLDVSTARWSSVDGYMYLCKLHGSINWEEEDTGLFPIRERSLSSNSKPKRVMIYPTPAKQGMSFGSPYSDLFREFQSRVSREQSILITLGYRFGDEHINNLIFQALTIPTFRLIAFVSPNSPGIITTLRELKDPRIWIIGGEGPGVGRKAHYFDTFVERFMPEAPGNQVDSAVEQILSQLLGQQRETGGSNAD